MSLYISHISLASEGKYECSAHDGSVGWLNKHTVTVDELMEYTLKISTGQDINLLCLSPQYVQSNTSWYKMSPEGQKVPLAPVDGMAEDSNNSVEWLYANPDGHDHSITIKDATLSDSGTYHCESTTGEKFSTIHLVVEVPPTQATHSCADFLSPLVSCAEPNSRSGAAILRESLSEFSMRLYYHQRLLRPEENLLYSPISIGSLLTHLLLGTRGTTHHRLEDALRLPRNFSCVHRQMRVLRKKLSKSLHMASQVFHQADLNLTKPFQNQSLEYYGSLPASLKTDGLANAEMINRWVSKHTKGTITHLLDILDPHTQLVLLNAVAFNGRWETRFESADQTEVFTKLNGDTVTVPVLYSSQLNASIKYIPELKAQVMLLPLTGSTSLYILLPRSHSRTDLLQLEEALNDRLLAHTIKEVRGTVPEVIEVTLPKIRLDPQTDMEALLRKLGLSELFEKPNLCGLHTEAPLQLDGARHQAFLALTEEGVEAGAATATFYSRSFPSFSAMRPFVLLLWSDTAGVPLFMGRVVEP